MGSEMMGEVGKNHAQVKSQVSTRAKSDDAEVETKPEESNEKEEEATQVEAKAEEAAPEVVQEPEEEIIIGDKTFKTQSEAIAYAEQLQRENEVVQTYNQGIQDTLRAIKNPPVEEAPKEDKFEEEFYTNPKQTLEKVKQSARDEAVQLMKQEKQREDQWSQFLTENPDIVREDAEMILARNWETLGKMTDFSAAKKVLAVKTRSYYQSIIDRSKPRTELPNKGGQVVSTGGTGGAPVLHQKKQDSPVDFVSQMKNFKRR